MKIVPLSEAKARLSHYGKACHQEPIVVTVNGKPAFQLVPLGEEDDLIDRLIADHPGFRIELHKRLREPNVSADAALRRLRGSGRASVARKRVAARRTR
jgi:prevent-host-death family protein